MRVVLLFLIVFSTPVLARATDRVINYDDFIHLTFPQQIETIKLVHSFLSEYEHQQHLDSLRPQTKKRYNSYLKILNYFIGSAYGGDTNLFDKIPGEYKCYYGGWISLMKKDGNSSYCTHPKNLGLKENQDLMKKYAKAHNIEESDIIGFYNNVIKNFNEAETKPIDEKKKTPEFNLITVDKDNRLNDFITENKCRGTQRFGNQSSAVKKTLRDSHVVGGTNYRQSMVCNPNIYGRYNKKPFCVLAGKNQGINISYLCAKAVEKVRSTDLAGYNTMMKDLVTNAITGNNSEFFDTLKSMYDSCLCGGDSGLAKPTFFQGSISKKYAKRIFYTRTCVGIISQTQFINESFKANSCVAKQIKPEHVKWLGYMKNAESHLNSNIIKARHEKLSYLNVLNPTRGSGLASKSYAEDKQQFGTIVNDNFEIAKKHNLCPIDGNQPSLVASFDRKTNILTVTANLEGMDPAANIAKPTLTATPEKAGEAVAEFKAEPRDDKSKKNIYKWKVTRKTQTNVKATQKIGTTELESPPAMIPADEKAKGAEKLALGLSLSGTVLTMEISGIEEADLKDYTVVDPKVVDEALDPKPSITKKADQEKPDGLIRKFDVTQLDKAYKVAASIKETKNTDNKAEAEAEVPKLESSAADANSCKVSIKSEIANGKVKLTAKLTHTVDGKEVAFPETAKIKVGWFSLNAPAKKKKKKKDSADNLVDDEKIEDAVADARKPADDAKTKSKKENEVTKLQKKYLKVASKGLSLAVGQGRAEQKFAITIESQEPKCSVTKAASVPALEAPAKTNSSPFRQAPPRGPQRGMKILLNGNR